MAEEIEAHAPQVQTRQKLVTTKGKITNSKVGSAIVIDLGKKKRKQVNQLRKGKGRLMRKVQRIIEELQAYGDLPDASRPIIIIAEKKPRKAAVSV